LLAVDLADQGQHGLPVAVVAPVRLWVAALLFIRERLMFLQLALLARSQHLM
jgi:hypothetical protein